MYKLFNIVEHKTDIKGFLLNKGKVYINNIVIVECFIDFIYRQRTKKLFNSKEFPISYTMEGKAYIKEFKDNFTILKYCIRYKEKHLKYSYIKELLKQHQRLIIYREDKHFIIEIWEG